MSDNHNDSVWPKIILWSCIAGAVAFLLLLFMAKYTAVGALLLGVLVAILVAILLWIGWFPSDDSANSDAAASSVSSTAPATTDHAASAPAQQDTSGALDDARVKAAAAMPAATATAPVAEIKPSKELAGQKELSERKGEWKYEAPEKDAAKAAGVSSTMALAETAKEVGNSAEKAPAAKKTAAKKTAAKKPAATKTATKPAAKKPAAKSTAAKADTATKPATKAPARKPVAKDGKPELLKKARKGGPDDLKQIKGVGPKLEGILHEMGIYHFDQVASWRKKEVEWVDNALTGVNKGRPTRDDWVKQAKVLAKGGETEFSKRVKKGGVY